MLQGRTSGNVMVYHQTEGLLRQAQTKELAPVLRQGYGLLAAKIWFKSHSARTVVIRDERCERLREIGVMRQKALGATAGWAGGDPYIPGRSSTGRKRLSTRAPIEIASQ